MEAEQQDSQEWPVVNWYTERNVELVDLREGSKSYDNKGRPRINRRESDSLCIKGALILMPKAAVPEEWWKELGGSGLGPVAEHPGLPFAMFNETEVEKRSLHQFSNMLFDSDDQFKPGGYQDLLALKDRLSKHIDISANSVVREAKRIAKEKRKGARSGGRSNSHHRDFPESFGPLKQNLSKYLTVQERARVLWVVIDNFEVAGVLPSKEDLCEARVQQRTASQGPGPFEVQMEAIRAVVTDPEHLDDLRYNSELYRKAADVAGLRFDNDPADSIRSNIKNNFAQRFGEDPPGTPQAWQDFFQNGTAPQSGKRNGTE
jgi:hypothetical protein